MCEPVGGCVVGSPLRRVAAVAAMSSVQSLREFISERLTAAAEEIFRQFEKTIVQYEEEMDRQRRLLDYSSWKRSTNTADPLQLPDCKEEELLPQQHLSTQEKELSRDQEDTEAPEIKGEQEHLYAAAGEGQVVLKQEADTFMVTVSFEESDLGELEPAAEQLLSENHNPQETKYGVFGSTPAADVRRQNRSVCQYVHVENFSLSETHSQTDIGEISASRSPSSILTLPTMRSPVEGQKPGRKPSANCNVCGKSFSKPYALTVHMRTHTGEKPYSCKMCLKEFRQKSVMLSHMRTHTGEKPYLCRTCGQRFRQNGALQRHVRIHTGEKPYSCDVCKKRFRESGKLPAHMRSHTGEKPFSCDSCGKRFSGRYYLKRHMKMHTDAKS